MQSRSADPIVDDRTIVFRTKTCYQALVRMAAQLKKADAASGNGNRRNEAQIMDATLIESKSAALRQAA